MAASNPDFSAAMDGIRTLVNEFLSGNPDEFRSVYYENGRAILDGELSESVFIGPDSILLLTTSDGRDGRLRANDEGLTFDEEDNSSNVKMAWPFP